MAFIKSGLFCILWLRVWFTHSHLLDILPSPVALLSFFRNAHAQYCKLFSNCFKVQKILKLKWPHSVRMTFPYQWKYWKIDWLLTLRGKHRAQYTNFIHLTSWITTLLLRISLFSISPIWRGSFSFHMLFTRGPSFASFIAFIFNPLSAKHFSCD